MTTKKPIKKVKDSKAIVKKAPTKLVEKPKMGRPTKRTPEVVERILDGLSKGRTLTSICDDENMPHVQAFYDWKEKDEELSIRFARAREKGYDAIADECLRIADFSALDTLINEKTGNPCLDSEWVARSRLRVETRLKLLAKWSPKKYGDKIEVDNKVTIQPYTEIGGDAN